jgi:hypothetical protein
LVEGEPIDWSCGRMHPAPLIGGIGSTSRPAPSALNWFELLLHRRELVIAERGKEDVGVRDSTPREVIVEVHRVPKVGHDRWRDGRAEKQVLHELSERSGRPRSPDTRSIPK